MWIFSDKSKGRALIAGSWQEGAAAFDVRNPADGEIIASVPDMKKADALSAIEAARDAFQLWKDTPAKDRAAFLERWAELVRDNAEDLAELLTAEQGKPFMEAVGEIITAAECIEWFAKEALKISGETAQATAQDASIHISREPVGVVAAITPWNFPAAMVARKLAPAFAAGCTVVLKPSEETPLTALALAELAERAGLPPGVLNVVTSDRASAADIGKALLDSPDVRKISFTGSTAVGKYLISQSAPTVKRLSMELGGNAPFIVLQSADLDKAVKGVLTAKFMNAGQMCVSPNRIFVHESLYDAFAQKLADEAANIKVGPGDDMESGMGPLINKAAANKVQRHVDDAVAKGAEVLCGGGLAPAGEPFFLPTVLTGMKPDMLIAKEETFGPVAALFSFRDEAEVITSANATQAGLAAYVYGEDEAQCSRVAAAIDCGMVCINESLIIDAAIPFGGMKESGLGRENSRFGLDGYQEIKTTIIKNKGP